MIPFKDGSHTLDQVAHSIYPSGFRMLQKVHVFSLARAYSTD